MFKTSSELHSYWGFPWNIPWNNLGPCINNTGTHLTELMNNNNIKYNIPLSGNVAIKVVDIIGTPVRVILNEHDKPGNYEVSLDAEALPPGKYYYKVLYSGISENLTNETGKKEETIASGQVKIEI